MPINRWALLFCIIAVTAFTSADCLAQADTIRTEEKELAVILKKRFDPRKATLLSAALPGLGQAYNRQYWKVPLIYAGAATIGYFIIYNNQEYVKYRDWYIAQRTASENKIVPLPVMYNGAPASIERLKYAKDVTRRNRDLTIILAGLLYTLNIVDANVFAHLKGFTLSEDLAMSVTPGAYSPTNAFTAAGVTVKLHFK